jgi:mannosylglycerate hydrolase MGH1-like protein
VTACAMLEDKARGVLAANDRGDYTAPSSTHYPHQWLWDSAFVAIGLAHLDPRRAAREIDSLMAAQWANGMVPHMVFARHPGLRPEFDLGRLLWQSHLNPDAPRARRTSGITQPPVLAEAVWRVGTALDASERGEFFSRNLPRLVRYHAWFYRERDPSASGLVVSVHPWETGMDNSPVWTNYMGTYVPSTLADLSRRPRIRAGLRCLRGDIKRSAESERIDLGDGLRSISATRGLRRWRYGAPGPPPPDVPQIQDVAVNSILIRANAILALIAAEVGASLPADLEAAIGRAPAALMLLWDAAAGLFFSRDSRSQQLLRFPTAASLLPLYTDGLPRDVAATLATHLRPGSMFDAPFPVPTVPLGSGNFREETYWAGPTWVNINWTLVVALERAGGVRWPRPWLAGRSRWFRSAACANTSRPRLGEDSVCPTFRGPRRCSST